MSVDEADDTIFGYVLLNDWSGRDIQTWEYQPLGPFQAKAFATTISPWVITKAALEPFRCPTPKRDMELLPYIRDTRPMNYDIDLSVSMAAQGGQPTVISRTNSNGMYYSSAQQLAHHASSGCAMRTGDLLGSGTISGPDKGTYGSLLELSWGGEDPSPSSPARPGPSSRTVTRWPCTGMRKLTAIASGSGRASQPFSPRGPPTLDPCTAAVDHARDGSGCR